MATLQRPTTKRGCSVSTVRNPCAFGYDEALERYEPILSSTLATEIGRDLAGVAQTSTAPTTRHSHSFVTEDDAAWLALDQSAK